MAEAWLREVERYAAGMPMVRTSDGHFVPWDREAIVRQLLRETQLAFKFFGVPPITREEAEEIAREAEERIVRMRAKFVSAPLIREVVNNILLERSSAKPAYAIYRNVLTRVGVPVYDAYLIDIGEGYEARENANLQPNPETSHKKKGDRVSKEEYLLLMDPRLADAHLKGDLHIHDLEYFGTRPFCQDWDLRYFLYYGLMPDGMGLKTSVAGPAKHPEVALLHSVKALASAQTNFAGGQGFFNYTVFMAPFIRGLTYREVKQLAQMMFYELTQIYVARGGQMVFSNIQLVPGVPELWRDKPVVAYGRVGPETYGSYEDEARAFFRAIYEVALEGDWWGKPFNFPKLEGGITAEFFKPEFDEDWLLVHRVVSKYGTPYFDNMLPAYRGYGRGVSCYQCVPGDELIVVRRGGSIDVVEARDVGPEDEVLACSLNSLSARFSRPLSMLARPYNGYVYTVQLEGGRRIRVTEDHPMPVVRDGRQVTVPAREVRPGDAMFVLLKFPREVVREVEVDEGVLSSRARRRLPRRVAVSKEFAELLGLYFARGSAKKVPRGGVVRFYFRSGEGELAEYVRGLVERVFQVDARTYRLKSLTVVQVGSVQLYRFLVEQLKAGSNSLDRDVPWVVFHFPEEAIRAFLRGAFVGAGGARLRLPSRRACQKLALLSGLAGLALSYYELKRKGGRAVYVCRVGSKRALERLLSGRPALRSRALLLKVRRVSREEFSGPVYDPVEVEGNHFVNALGVVTHNCCAYVFTDTPETDPDFEAKMFFEDGKHFSMGGMQVVTLNLPRAAYKARGDDDRLVEELMRLMDLAVDIFETKRKWIETIVKAGRLPFAVQRPRDPRTGRRGPPAVDLSELVYTIGVVGGNEMAQWHTGRQLHEDKDAVRLLVKVLLEMRKYKSELEQKSGLKIALARTPAESCAQRLAVADLASPEFRDMAASVVKGDLEEAKRLMAEGARDVPVYYTNGTHVYVGAQVPLAERIQIEQKFWPILSGGNIFHIWLGEAYPDPEALLKVTKRIATQTQIGYFAYTKDLTICESCVTVSSGLNESCPACGSASVRYWSRVTGYYQEVSGWNAAKRRELRDRYRVKAVL
ncbi:MAG: anaerobic ribonucleoside-triphosphate reductase [Candidatus Nezhaarchaeales archaeon]